MKKYIVLLVFLFSVMSSYAIIPPNPDMCLDCDSTPWTTGTLVFTYNYLDNGIPASCNITVGYGYRFCNGAIDTYIDRLFLPPGSCYTYVRNLPGFYERCENELLLTDYQPAQYEACDDYPDNHFDCDYASDCIIECR